MQHALEFEVRLELFGVYVVFGNANLLGVEIPVGSSELEVATLGIDHGLDVGCLASRVAHGCWRDASKHGVNVGGVASGLVADDVLGVRCKTKQLGALGA